MSLYLPKILIVTLDYPPAAGGVGEYMRGLVTHYPAKKITVLKHGEKDLVYQQAGRQIIQKRFFSRLIWPTWLKIIILVYQQVKKGRFDIIITPNLLPLGTVLFLVKWLIRTPYYISLHGLDIGLVQKNGRKKILAKIVLRQAAGIIVNSRYTKNLVLDFLPVQHPPIYILYPCLTKYPQAKTNKRHLRCHYDLNPDQLILLSVGRLVKRKGFDLIIKVLPRLLKRFSNIYYVLVGRGPEDKYLQRLIKDRGLETFVRIVSSSDEEVLDNYYSLADIFLMPSRLLGPDVEGFGLVYLEAGSHNLPVIGTTTGGIPEAVLDKKSGWLIEPDSESALESALNKFIQSPDLRRQLGECGRWRAQEVFNWEKEMEPFIFWLNNHER